MGPKSLHLVLLDGPPHPEAATALAAVDAGDAAPAERRVGTARNLNTVRVLAGR